MLFDILSHCLCYRIFVKLIYILTIIILVTSLFLGLMGTKVQAAQYTEKYKKGNLKDYSGYETLLQNLKKAHPNWTFTILYTGLDWNTVLKNETTSAHGRNLVDGSKTGAWVCPTCADNKYDNGSWKCASEATVAYYMDPRNSLFEDYIFQFENLKWVDDLYTIDGINKILSDCKYLQGSKITYKATDGKEKTINKSYAQVIYEAAKENKVSPYHLAARIRQEQGPGKEASMTATGDYKDYIGYYNFFNVNASGSGSSTIIKNALKYAKTAGWTDPEKSIKGGVAFLVSEYIDCGQNTLYLQKFDVDSSDGDLYWHQYMQNVSAAKTEGSELLATYSNMLDEAFNFIIPVYEKMPSEKCPQPASQQIVTQNIEVTNEIIVRKSKSETAEKIGTLKKGDKALRIEIGGTKTNGNLWDKVVLENGKNGYIISDTGFKVVGDISNCNIRATAIEEGNVRNGPGTSGTTVITTLSIGQIVTIVEQGKYKNVNGYDWSRIYLADGRQGYIVSEYIEEATSKPPTDTGEQQSKPKKEIVKVVTSSGLSVRAKPGTDAEILKYVEKGDYLTRIDKEVSTKNGYIWDQVITEDGIEGYVARGDKDGDYIQVVEDVESSAGLKGNGFKTSGTNMICEPKITAKDIKSVAKDAVIKNKSGKEVTSGNVGTGYTVKFNGQTYSVVKKGDSNGDGKMTPADSTVVLKAYVGSSKLSTSQKLAGDVNGDGKITPADSTVVLRAYVGLADIKI